MSWINKIANGIEKAFSTVRAPLQIIPPILLICEVYQRPGLSAIALASSIIKRLPEAGIETGVKYRRLYNVHEVYQIPIKELKP